MTSQPVIYEQCDIPPGMTCDEYRRRKIARGRSEGAVARLARRGRIRGARLRDRPAAA